VLGEPSALQYDGILGRDFLEERESVINYCSRQIIMNEVFIDFDVKPCVGKTTL
jgi:methylaspartate ammonia-lyase